MESHQEKEEVTNVNERMESLSFTKEFPGELTLPQVTTTLSRGIRWTLFIVLVLISFLSALDGGIIPAAKDAITKDLVIDNEGFGFLGSVDFIGRIVGSLIFTAVINKINRKYLLIATLLLKGVVIIGSSFQNIFILQLVLRGISGLSQVFFTIYISIWCDQYGVRKRRTMMITIIQAVYPFGVVVGYGLFMLTNSWKISLLIEGIIMLALGVTIFFFKALYFSHTLILAPESDDEAYEEPIESTTNTDTTINNGNLQDNMISPLKKSPMAELWSNIKVIFCEGVFIFTGVSNSICFFVMNVIQFWGPDYMSSAIEPSDPTVRFIAFGAICITAPILGIVLGGVTASCFGGYTNKKAIFICIVLSVISMGLGFVVPFMHTLTTFSIVIWIYFFFTTAMMPIETGIIISSLPIKIRGDGFSVMNFLLNLFGNMPSAYIFGVLIQVFDNDQREALRTVMYYNIVGLVALVIAAIFRMKKQE